jgi:hypothetical protein
MRTRLTVIWQKIKQATFSRNVISSQPIYPLNNREATIFCLIIALIASISACQQNKRRDNATKIVREWTGKEIKFPATLSCTSMGKDTTCIDLHNNNYKILLYIDSIGCSSCKMQQLISWKKLMNEFDTAFIRKPEFVFIFQPKKRDEKALQSIFRQHGFLHPVFIDKNDEIDKINNFPLNPEYQCFLLDKDNKVLLVGNPATVSGIWLLVKRIIKERETKVLTMEKCGAITSYHTCFPINKKGGNNME